MIFMGCCLHKAHTESYSPLVASRILETAKTGVLVKAASQTFRMGVHEGAHWVWKDVYSTEVEFTRDFGFKNILSHNNCGMR